VVTSLSSKEDFVAYIEKEAPRYGLSAKKVEDVVACETGNTWDPSIQSGYYKNGIREDSWGLAQLNRPLTKGITYAQAKDPKFSLDYLMSHWHKDHWSCM
jgi:hypothetical protein